MMERQTGVIVVDVQGDFTEWKEGALAASYSEKGFVKQVESATRSLQGAGFPICATQDWHPDDHLSFYTSHPGKKSFDTIELDGRTQTLWPPHCVQGTPKAKILVDNNLFLAVVHKGMDKEFDSYSGFQDEGGKKTELEGILRRNGIDRVILYGVATDYCVQYTALDAVQADFEVILIKDLCRGVAPDSSRKALENMEKEGVTIHDTLDMDEIKRL